MAFWSDKFPPTVCALRVLFFNPNSAKKESEKKEKAKMSLFGEGDASPLWISFVTHIFALFILLANLSH